MDIYTCQFIYTGSQCNLQQTHDSTSGLLGTARFCCVNTTTHVNNNQVEPARNNRCRYDYMLYSNVHVTCSNLQS